MVLLMPINNYIRISFLCGFARIQSMKPLLVVCPEKQTKKREKEKLLIEKVM